MKKLNLTLNNPDKYKKGDIVKKFWNRKSYEEIKILRVVELSNNLMLTEWKYVEEAENMHRTLFKLSSDKRWRIHRDARESLSSYEKYS